MKFFVVARNTQQAREWVRNKKEHDIVWALSYPMPNDIIILTNPSQARGFEITTGVLLDGWRQIPDIKDLIEVLCINSRGKNKTLVDIYEELNPAPQMSRLTGINIEHVILDELTKQFDKQVLKGLLSEEDN